MAADLVFNGELDGRLGDGAVAAALDRADRAARRERLGIKDNELPPSQVGNRRYARGRAYVPDRFTNPETAEEATLAAAAESEFAPAIDESIPDDVPAVETAEVETEVTEAAEETIESASETVPAEEAEPVSEESKEE